ncbi:hypothetical protein M9H77_26845 [Catharanthus roseus]|uniref:Uncharacterized protein n=1 Tax=Catharanthus roseus TaxID=4058 RepID=A0ACC0ADI7_CATRO|nr:hypothetical protein M9H77_26845 [Catharanthus roseus]
MEEVPAHAHPGPIIPDLLTRQQEHSSTVDSLVLPVEDLSSPRDDYIRWYWDITRVYINNPTYRNTRIIGYPLVGVDRQMMTSMLQEVDDMTIGVLEGPPSSPTLYASVMRKV